MKTAPNIHRILRPLDQAPLQVILTASLQVADILEFAIGYVGEECHVRQSTFSISEEFLRRLFFIKKRHPVRSLSLVLDFKAINKTVALWPFISRVADAAFLAPNHSKAIIVTSKKKRVAIVTSQNLTRGNRFESTIITTDPEVVSSLSAQMDELIHLHSIPLDEIFRRTDKDDNAARIPLLPDIQDRDPDRGPGRDTAL